MIELTRLNSSLLVVNSDLIQYVESAPDTTITLVNGEKVVVRESAAEVIELAIAFRARLMAEAARHSPEGMVPAFRGTLPTHSAPTDLKSFEDAEPGSTAAARRRRIES